jgi:hypothetical protein
MTIGQCEGILCIMLFRIKLKHDVFILGGLCIGIMYDASHMLSLESAMINSTPKFVIVVVFVNDTLSS